MDEQRLRYLLKELRDEFEKSENLPVVERDRLQNSIESVEAKLDRKEHPASHPTAIQDLEDTATRFEVTHPTLTEAIARVINGLSNMGI